jgi:predicted transcriptional regulator
MNHTMNQEQVKLAMRIIGLRGTSMKAKKNYWHWAVNRASLDQNALGCLLEKGYVTRIAETGREYKLTPQGIQQLKQQIGEFHF